MADADLRGLERAAARHGSSAADRLRRAKVRSGRWDEPARQFVDMLTSEGALWLAGVGWLTSPAQVALRWVLVDWGLAELDAIEQSSAPVLTDTLVALCRERARREWDPIRAIAILGSRRRIKVALGVSRMPRGTAVEERRQRQLWVENLDPYYWNTDVVWRSWRPPKPQPWPMGWEDFVQSKQPPIRLGPEW